MNYILLILYKYDTRYYTYRIFLVYEEFLPFFKTSYFIEDYGEIGQKTVKSSLKSSVDVTSKNIGKHAEPKSGTLGKIAG